ncbi:hypothetical protein [Streptomyces sp. NPDC047028]|uniref:hypothetical protein n=1 Tax=Streptomyces sp. NPDC047028 TaxID=3155793 RepID=UPI00340B55DC
MRPARVFRSTTWPHGRRGAVLAASAAVVCAGAVLGTSTGGGGSRDGYVAVGGVPRQPSGTAGKPTGAVRMVPLDGDAKSSRPSGTSVQGAKEAPGTAPGTSGTPDPSADNSGDTGNGDAGAPPSSHGTGTPTPTGPASPKPPSPTPTPTGPPAPAALTWGTQTRQPTDRRWCEKVTVPFRNSGGTAVRAGTVTFRTHVIGALGIDWSTVESTVDLPAPIGPGTHRSATWTVCVDAWRVPLGMHIETRDVSVRWS